MQLPAPVRSVAAVLRSVGSVGGLRGSNSARVPQPICAPINHDQEKMRRCLVKEIYHHSSLHPVFKSSICHQHCPVHCPGERLLRCLLGSGLCIRARALSPGRSFHSASSIAVFSIASISDAKKKQLAVNTMKLLVGTVTYTGRLTQKFRERETGGRRQRRKQKEREANRSQDFPA